MEKAREFQKNIYFFFIDYAKAFDCVDHNKLWKILNEMGIPDHLICLLRNLYAGQEATVRSGHGTTDCFQIGKSSMSSGEGNGTPLQYSCLENPMDRGAWKAAVHGVTEAWTRLKRLSSSSSRLVIAFLPRGKHLLISWLQSPSAVILEPPKNKV